MNGSAQTALPLSRKEERLPNQKNFLSRVKPTRGTKPDQIQTGWHRDSIIVLTVPLRAVDGRSQLRLDEVPHFLPKQIVNREFRFFSKWHDKFNRRFLIERIWINLAE